MKKVLGILALVLSISGIASADQDTVKDVYFNQEFRGKFKDLDGSNANKIGNAGFKKKNVEGVKSVTEVGTDLKLNDEAGLDGSLYYKHDETAGYKNGKKTNVREVTDLIDTNLSKNVQWGNLDTNTKLGIRHWTNRAGKKHVNTVGESNEFYFGPTFSVNVLGQTIKTTAEAVYFLQNGNADQDGRYYHTAAKYDDKGKKIGDYAANHGWGANIILGTDGKIAEGGFGKFSYDVSLEHYLRDASGKDNKSNVKLDYTVGLNYDTPSFGGFYGYIRPENEWTKHTAIDGYTNEFTVWTGVGYKANIDTSVGTVSINPSVKYSPVNKNTKKSEDKKNTTETNELRAGVKVGLTVK